MGFSRRWCGFFRFILADTTLGLLVFKGQRPTHEPSFAQLAAARMACTIPGTGGHDRPRGRCLRGPMGQHEFG